MSPPNGTTVREQEPEPDRTTVRKPRKPSAGRRIGTLLRFPVGVLLVSWQYMWRITALHRSETEGDAGDLPPRLPPELVDACSKTVGDGAGPLYHRRFRVRVGGARLGPEELMDTVAADLNRPAPSSAAVFHKTRGEGGDARVGDEYRVQMPGPWDGPVRVLHRDASSLRLGTLHGHLEAGQIQFSARACDRGSEGGSDAAGDVEFMVEAWARAGDRWADLLYGRLRVAKEIQFNMWVHFSLGAARIAGGRLLGGVTIDTRHVPEHLCRQAALRPAG